MVPLENYLEAWQEEWVRVSQELRYMATKCDLAFTKVQHLKASHAEDLTRAHTETIEEYTRGLFYQALQRCIQIWNRELQGSHPRKFWRF